MNHPNPLSPHNTPVPFRPISSRPHLGPYMLANVTCKETMGVRGLLLAHQLPWSDLGVGTERNVQFISFSVSFCFIMQPWQWRVGDDFSLAAPIASDGNNERFCKKRQEIKTRHQYNAEAFCTMHFQTGRLLHYMLWHIINEHWGLSVLCLCHWSLWMNGKVHNRILIPLKSSIDKMKNTHKKIHFSVDK